ncbi:MAG: plasmid pRiA4b ORF-3 family protein [Sporolactobacillus sp.]
MKTKTFQMSETDPPTLTADFLKFLSYIESHQITVTATREYMRQKDLRAFAQIVVPEYDISLRANQQDYPSTHLFYHLALHMKIMRIGSVGNTQCAWIQKNKAEEFRALSSGAQYIRLLKTFWLDLDWQELQGGKNVRAPDLIDFLFEALDSFPINQPIDLSKQTSVRDCLRHFRNFFDYFQLFGLWTFERKDETAEIDARSLTLTPLFKTLSPILVETWSPDGEEMPVEELFKAFVTGNSFEEKKEKKKEDKSESFFDAMAPFFAVNSAELLEFEDSEQGGTSNYLLKVSLAPSCWRKIQLVGEKTLLDLHRMIQQAFSFDDDHLYAFFMDGKKFGRQGYYAPGDNQDPHVDKIKLDALDLYEGQRFLYLFDYGDEWEFRIEVIKKVPGDPCDSLICESKGEAPDQYGY